MAKQRSFENQLPYSWRHFIKPNYKTGDLVYEIMLYCSFSSLFWQLLHMSINVDPEPYTLRLKSIISKTHFILL